MRQASTAPKQPCEPSWELLIQRTAEGDEDALAALYDGTAALEAQA